MQGINLKKINIMSILKYNLNQNCQTTETDKSSSCPEYGQRWQLHPLTLKLVSEDKTAVEQPPAGR